MPGCPALVVLPRSPQTWRSIDCLQCSGLAFGPRGTSTHTQARTQSRVCTTCAARGFGRATSGFYVVHWTRAPSLSCTGHVHPLCRALDTCSAHSLCRALDTCTPSLCALLLSDICCHVCCHVTVCCAARCCKRVRTWPHLCSLLRPLPRASCHHVHTQGRQTFGAGARAVSLSTHYTSKWRNFLDSRCVFATGSQHLWCRGSQSKHSLCGSVL